MARTPEGRAKDAVDNLLDFAKVYYICPATAGYGVSGAADRVGCSKGTFFGVEVKADTPVTALQEKHLKQILEAGGRAFVVRITSKREVTGLAELARFLGVKDYEAIAFATRKKTKSNSTETVHV